MHNFDFYNPTHILFGQGQIAQLAKVVPAQARVLMLYGGGSIKQNGVYDQVKQALSGHTVREFGGIEPNPSYETLMRAVALIKQENVDFLLAVGGGSVIDGTKFIAAAAVFEDGDPWQILEKGGKLVKAALPFGSVLTLPATGSEMNSASVITRSATQDKLAFASRLVYPKFSILDPAVTYTLPARQVGNGVVDAFVHVMEQYMTYPADAPLQDRFAEGLLLTLIEEGPKALAQPDNYAVRANVMWSATLALNGLIGVGVPQDWATHMVGHELTALYNLDHAQTLAVVLPSMLRVRKDSKRAKLLQFAERVWNLRDGDEDSRIEAAIARMQAFFEQMGVKTTLSGYGLDRGAVDAVVEALIKHQLVQLGEHRDVTAELSRTILEQAL
ncbi:iron-containing alcohol dehydrogenase [Duganella callida]|uniref:Iron-containing alcohol dehydrogenase n=1 Tax=Duganella callida TaxID=2561932 RepID=A0A4Y9SDA8_9BURK|nr:iron-containing alcohol dehydrogenase [Duganella callida]TFW18492.1 iron-containing alcohol dehydrogenase [Duganella callida]